MKDDQDIKNIDAVDDTFRCHAAKQKLIPVVFDKKQNKLIDVDVLFTTTKNKAVSIRSESLRSCRARESRYLCCFCHEAVYFRFNGKNNAGAHAVHREHSGNCIDTRFNKSREKINKAKYPINESDTHIKTKGYLFESLRQDSRFKNLRLEKRLKDKHKKKYQNGVTVHRQPDILAEFNGVHIAFEVQHSNMYLSDFIGKSSFYAEQNVLLFWVITKHFATDWKNNQASVSVLDLMRSNNYNIFFINEKTVKASEDNKKFNFYCLWDESQLHSLNGRIKIYHEKKFQQMFFDDLTIDLDHQDIFYFNYRLEWSKIEEKFGLESSSKIIKKLWETKQRYALYTPSFLKFVNTENAINNDIQQKQKRQAKRREKNRAKIRKAISEIKRIKKNSLFKLFVEREKELKRVKVRNAISAIKDIKNSSLFKIYAKREKEIQLITRVQVFSQREKFENFFFDLVDQIPPRDPDFKCKLKEFLEENNIKVLLPILDREQHFVPDMYFLYALYSIKYNKVIGFNFDYISNTIGFVSRGYSQYNYLLYRFVCKLNQSKESNIILDKDAHLNESNSQMNDLSITLNTPIIGEILVILFPGYF